MQEHFTFSNVLYASTAHNVHLRTIDLKSREKSSFSNCSLICRVTVFRHLKIFIATRISESSAKALSPMRMPLETPETVDSRAPIRVLGSKGIRKQTNCTSRHSSPEDLCAMTVIIITLLTFNFEYRNLSFECG